MELICQSAIWYQVSTTDAFVWRLLRVINATVSCSCMRGVSETALLHGSEHAHESVAAGITEPAPARGLASIFIAHACNCLHLVPI